MTCSSCNKGIGGRSHKFEVGEIIYTTCIPCVKKAKVRLEKLKYKTFEEDLLYKELRRVLVVN